MTGRAATADLIITGRVATLGGSDGFGWEKGVAIADGRIAAVGDEHDLEALAGPNTRRWSLPPDAIVMPGITDAHLHLMTMVLAEGQLELTGTDLPGALELVRQRHNEMLKAGSSDGWLLGHGWSMHELGAWPDADMLETVAPGRPIALMAHDHHSRWVSLAALARAGIVASTPNPEGGLVRRNTTGEATGILHESASALVDPVIPVPSAQELERSLASVVSRMTALGLTGCHDPGELIDDPDLSRGPRLYSALDERGQLGMRVHSSIRADQMAAAIELGLSSGQGLSDKSDRFRMGWLKLFADGSLGSRSAALLAPYSDAWENPPTGGPTGMFISDRDELSDDLRRASEAGICGQVHAIGDAAVRVVLDVLTDMPDGPVLANGMRTLRRVEHAQLIDPADVQRFGQLGIAASVQPVHLRSDAAPARIAWGERSENAFPLKGLVDGGALIPIGTDSPVEPFDPWPGVAVAVARRDPFDPSARPTGTHHAIDLARALRAACLDPALVAGESELGRLVAGNRADMLIVPSEGFRTPYHPAVFAATRPLATLIDGEVVYRSESADFAT